jgi:hypothetical protein
MNSTVVPIGSDFRVLHPAELGMKHIMIDLETMSTKKNAAIMAIGAIAFDIETGRTGEEFYQKVDLKSCERWGLHFEADTVYWWLEQQQSVREEMSRDRKELYRVLQDLQGMIGRCAPDVQVWGNGLGFDIIILRSAYEAIFKNTPWHHTKERDVRTLVSLLPEVKADTAFRGLKHHPLADCRHQIEYCSEIYRQLKRNRA